MHLPDLPRVDAYLAYHATHKKGVDAWVEGERRISFSLAQAWVDALAESLLLRGVSHGQRVAVYGRPSPEFMALFLAISGIGAIYVGLNPKYTESELAVILDDCRPALVIQLLEGQEAHRLKLQALQGRVGAGCKVVAYSDVLAGEEGASLADGTLQAAREAIASDDTAMLVYTSGSTGTPKGAQLTHRGMVFIAPITNDPAHFGVEGQGRTLCNLPINHVGCVVDLCTNSLVLGTTIVFQPEFDPDAMLSAIEEHRLTVIGGVPAMFLALSRSPRFLITDYSSLQRIVIAGNQPPLPLVRLLCEVTRRPVMNGYGLTEAMGFSTFTSLADDPETIAETVGRFDPRVEWRIADSKGPVSEPGIAGEIQLRGNWLFSGYFGRPEATAEAFAEDGWFRTGDIAMLTAQGNVKLVGRSKEMFKSGGYNVFPLEIEQALEKLEGVTMAVVVPVPDEVFTEVGYAFVVTATPRPGAGPLAESEIRQSLKARLANYKIPKHFEIVENVPMLPVGKVDRLALKAQAREAISQPGNDSRAEALGAAASSDKRSIHAG